MKEKKKNEIQYVFLEYVIIKYRKEENPASGYYGRNSGNFFPIYNTFYYWMYW